MYMLYKTGPIYLRVADPHFIFERICVRTIRTHMRHIPADFALTLKQVLSFCPIFILPLLLSGGDMYNNIISGSTTDTAKQWVVVIKGLTAAAVTSHPTGPDRNPPYTRLFRSIRGFTESLLQVPMVLVETRRVSLADKTRNKARQNVMLRFRVSVLTRNDLGRSDPGR